MKIFVRLIIRLTKKHPVKTLQMPL